MAILRYLRILLVARQTFARFPLAIILSIIASLLAVYAVESQSTSHDLQQLVQVGFLGAILFIGLELFGESVNFEFKARQYLNLLGFGLLALYFFTLPKTLNTVHYTRFFLFLISFSLSISVAPYLRRPEVESFWYFNEQLFIRLLTATFYSAVLYLGIMIAVVSIEHLFGWRFSDNFAWDMLILVVGVFNTWFFLAGVPQDFSRLIPENPYPQGVKSFVTYLLLPLLTVYLLILYLYFFKIILAWDLPQGWVAYLIVTYSLVGIMTVILLHPYIAHSRRVLAFRRRFYWTLLPLILLLWVGVGRRILDYGITENRYFLALLSVWLMAMSIYFLFSRNQRLYLIPLSLWLITFFAGFGPWGAFQMAERSQINRFAHYLNKYKLLQNGKISLQKARFAAISEADMRQLGAVINYLGNHDSLEELQPFFSFRLDSVLRGGIDPISKEEKLLQAIGNRELLWAVNLPIYSHSTHFVASSEHKLLKIKDFDYSLNFDQSYPHEQPDNFDLDDLEIRLKPYFIDNKLRIYNHYTDEILIEFDLERLIQKLTTKYARQPLAIPSADMTILLESSRYKAKLQLKTIQVIRRDKNISRGFSGTIFLKFY
ncbi:MAG: DUF4153 domain-containing protein [Microscillaceae bacterium]|jgi:hypothetical protein|nr:DUF4153 domain-containing protein [Microscillaceae bacterium]